MRNFSVIGENNNTVLLIHRLKWLFYQSSNIFLDHVFILHAKRQRFVVSLRRSFNLLSLQITDRDVLLGGDISFLCQLVNRRSHQIRESKESKRQDQDEDFKSQYNQFTINKQIHVLCKNICFSDFIVSSYLHANLLQS